MLKIDSSSLFIFLVAWPRPNGPFIFLLVNVNEPGRANRFFHMVDGVQITSTFDGALSRIRPPGIKDTILRYTLIVTLDHRASFNLLDPSAGS